MSTIRFGHSPRLSVFDGRGVGSLVVDVTMFEEGLSWAIQAHNPTKDRVPGQYFVLLPMDAWPSVSLGVGCLTQNPVDFVMARAERHGSEVAAFLRQPQGFELVQGVGCVVYTGAAYLAHPDVDDIGLFYNRGQIQAGRMTHVILSVLAFHRPPEFITHYQVVYSLVGGNRHPQAWTAEDQAAAEMYWNLWGLLANDPT